MLTPENLGHVMGRTVWPLEQFTYFRALQAYAKQAVFSIRKVAFNLLKFRLTREPVCRHRWQTKGRLPRQGFDRAAETTRRFGCESTPASGFPLPNY